MQGWPRGDEGKPMDLGGSQRPQRIWVGRYGMRGTHCARGSSRAPMGSWRTPQVHRVPFLPSRPTRILRDPLRSLLACPKPIGFPSALSSPPSPPPDPHLLGRGRVQLHAGGLVFILTVVSSSGFVVPGASPGAQPQPQRQAPTAGPGAAPRAGPGPSAPPPFAVPGASPSSSSPGAAGFGQPQSGRVETQQRSGAVRTAGAAASAGSSGAGGRRRGGGGQPGPAPQRRRGRGPGPRAHAGPAGLPDATGAALRDGVRPPLGAGVGAGVGIGVGSRDRFFLREDRHGGERMEGPAGPEGPAAPGPGPAAPRGPRGTGGARARPPRGGGGEGGAAGPGLKAEA